MEHCEVKRKLSFVQMHAYYKAFIVALDNADVELSDWEAKFVESNMEHIGIFTPKQEEVILKFMDKFLRVKPDAKYYSDDKAAHDFIYPKRVVLHDNRPRLGKSVTPPQGFTGKDIPL